jgi:four helix bundle protein
VPFSSNIAARGKRHRNDGLRNGFVNPFYVRRSAFGGAVTVQYCLIFAFYIQLIYLLLYIPFMDDFTQFDAFERCREFARGIARHLNHGAFSKDPVLATALRKTLLSIYSNFGEGFERDGNREFVQFVSVAKGSIGETRAQLIYALDIGCLNPETFSELDQLGKSAATCLGGLIRHLNNSSFRGRKFKQREDLPERP